MNDIYIYSSPIIDINVKLLACNNNNECNRVGVFHKSASRNAYNTTHTDKFGGWGYMCVKRLTFIAKFTQYEFK